MNPGTGTRVVSSLLGVIWLAAFPPAIAQVSGTPRQLLKFEYPPALPQRDGPAPPRLNLSLAGEIAVQGPLGRAALEFDQGRLILRNGGKDVAALPEPGAAVEILPELPAIPEDDTAWVVSADGNYRFRTRPEGQVEAERRSYYNRNVWKRHWRIRVPAATPSPPILVGPRLCWAGLDDMVVCVRADNGHRLWAVDVNDRVSRPLSVWTATMPFASRKGKTESLRTVSVLLVVPDSGRQFLVMDAYDGDRVAALDLPAERGRFASAPVVVSETRIAVARQGYVPDEAALSLIDLSLPEAHPGPDAAPIPYNDAPESKDSRSGGD